MAESSNSTSSSKRPREEEVVASSNLGKKLKTEAEPLSPVSEVDEAESPVKEDDKEDDKEEALNAVMVLNPDELRTREYSVGPSSGGGGVETNSLDQMGRLYIKNRQQQKSYVCHLCGKQGHFIKNCPSSNSTKKILPATGIPKNLLRVISPEDVEKYNEIFCFSDGKLAVMKSEGVVNRPAKSQNPHNPAIPEELRCPLCSNAYKEATLASCCGETYCKNCITVSLTKNGNKCPSCGQRLDTSDLEFNQGVQESVDAVLFADNNDHHIQRTVEPDNTFSTKKSL